MTHAEEASPIKRALVELRALRLQVDELEAQRAEPIALVGIGLRFPGGARTPQAFWELLRAGTDAIEDIPPERWDIDAYFDADYSAAGKMYTRGGGFLHDIDRFDAAFFGISPREAASMDPQQRLLLETAWDALEHAGLPPDKLYQSLTGVFLALGNSDYARMVWANTDDIDVYYATGTAFSVAAGRLSYLLGLQGPSLVLDTACSGSLVAVHLACHSLRSRESDLALAGGVNLILSPEANINFSKAQMLAPDDRCKTFDAAADGYVRSEGCGLVVLKRLSDALAAGDTIFAVIRGSAVNQDGRSSGLTAPNGPAQEAVLRAALRSANITPDQVQYVEAHGTGTSLGDPIELQALGAVFGPGRAAHDRLKIGAVKTNIGHLEAAAGVAGLIKTALALHYEAVPPHLHLRQPSPYVDWESLRLEVPTRLTPWPRGSQPRIAGVSSFGFSGTNAHVVLAEAPLPAAVSREVERPQQMLVLSGKSPAALRTRVEQFIPLLEPHSAADFANVLHSASAGRSHFSQRLAVSAGAPQELQAKLQAWLRGDYQVGVQSGQAAAAPEVAFLFSGQGEQYAAMGQQLYETQPLFRSVIDECDALLRPHLPQPLLAALYPDDGEPALLEQMKYAQTAIFSVEYALAKLWESWGIVPTMVLGHSVGEYAAACFAGVFSLADGLKLVAARGRLMDELAHTGAMVAVFADEDVVRRAAAPYADRAVIAAVNAPGNVVISGEIDALEAITELLRAQRVRSKRLAVAQASHSPLMEPMLDAFEQVARTVTFHAPRIGYVSGMTGDLAGGAAVGSPLYWRQHSREAVLFAAGMATLHAEGYRVFVEIGPNPSLLSSARRAVPEEGSLWLPSLRKGWDDWTQMLDSLGALYTAGVSVDWEGFDRPYARRRLPIPTYPWEGGRYWIDRAPAAPAAARPTWEVVARAAAQQAQQGPLELAVQTYAEKWESLAQLSRAYIVRTLRDCGLFTKIGERHTVADLLATRGFEPAYDHLLGRWLDALSAAGLLQRGDGLYTNRAPLPAPDLTGALARAQAAFADAQPLLAYVMRCGEKLTAVVTGQESPLETLFPDGSYDTVDYLYHDFPGAVYFNSIVTAMIQAAVEAAGGRTLRILEVGAGTGGTTAALLPALPAERVAYRFTDVSEFFLARAQHRFAAYPFVRFDLLNLENDALAQGYAPASFEVVVAANVLHATRHLDHTLRQLHQLLVPGGLLVLYETTQPQAWYDITTGLIEGWQLFEDRWRTDNPLLAAADWVEALRANGFNMAVAYPEAGSPAAILGQHVIVAQTAGGGASLGVAGQAEVADAPLAAQPAAAADDEAAAFVAALAAVPPADRLDALVDFVRGQVRRVLRLNADQPVERRARLMDIGFDSLMAVELRARLTAMLGLAEKLPATLIFDYPTPEAVAGYLLRVLALDPAPSAAAAAPLPVSPGQPPVVSETDLRQLTDEEVEAMLRQKLKDME